MIRLADYVAKKIADSGVKHIFMITGGGAMHLNDAIGRESRLTYICNHHEQACAIAAEGYARVTGKIGVLCVTSGPGGINALNGVFGAWTDSIPMLVISGQVKRETVKSFIKQDQLRQFGDQEADIIGMVKGITKYSEMVIDPQKIRFHLEKAMYLGKHGRPGPCWLDIPLDIQAALINENTLEGYIPPEKSTNHDWQLNDKISEIITTIKKSERPVILAGNGIRCAHAVELFSDLVKLLKIPVVVSRTAMDLLSYEDEFYIGRSGIDADRAGNFAVQNSDLLLVMGSRLGIRQVGYNWQSYARKAKIIHIDIDSSELSKKSINAYLNIESDLKDFMNIFQSRVREERIPLFTNWLEKCHKYKQRYTQFVFDKTETNKTGEDVVNPYLFMEKLSSALSATDTIVCGNGSAFIITTQTGHVKKGQRWFFNSGCASMGYELPAAIGASIGNNDSRVICMAGDGSIMMNIQELVTISSHKLPIKIFVYCNNGYLSIRQSQKAFFGRLVGESPESGVGLPELGKVANAFGIPDLQISNKNLVEGITYALATEGPILCEVLVDPSQEFEPRSSSKQMPDGSIVSTPLEDMYPFLNREEFLDNMVIPIWDPKVH